MESLRQDTGYPVTVTWTEIDNGASGVPWRFLWKISMERRGYPRLFCEQTNDKNSKPFPFLLGVGGFSAFAYVC